MATDAEIQELLNWVGGLMIDMRAVSAIMVSLVASEAKKSGDAEAWLRTFSDDAHFAISDRAGIQVEVARIRNRVDQIMTAASALANR